MKKIIFVFVLLIGFSSVAQQPEIRTPQICRGSIATLDAAIFFKDQWYIMLEHGSSFVLVEPGLVRFKPYRSTFTNEFYHVRITSGPQAGLTGYVFEIDVNLSNCR